MLRRYYFFVFFLITLSSCDLVTSSSSSNSVELTIFTMNDMHGQLDNFARVKHIVDMERKKGPVLFVSAGDIFSGNPVVDSHQEKGYPIIDLMNKVGVDVTVIGNHEYDYGEEHLKNRIAQGEFEFICANVNTENSLVPQPKPYKKISVGGLEILVLGLVETNGSDNEIIPSTHPWRVQNMAFKKPENVVGQFADLKKEQKADLYIALTHLGHDGHGQRLGDFQLAENFPFFDLVIGGHSHWEIDTMVNNIPIYQAGSNLKKLGRIDLKVVNKEITSIEYQLIDLKTYAQQDEALAGYISNFNNQAYLNDVVGYAEVQQTIQEVGCFVTEALQGQLNVDVAIHNSGGVRATLDKGEITKREIYEISPFNNGTVIYQMTIGQIKKLLTGSGSGYYYSGLVINQVGQEVEIRDQDGTILADDYVVSLGTNDYIPAVHAPFFPNKGEIQPMTQAETILAFLIDRKDPVIAIACQRYFRYTK